MAHRTLAGDDAPGRPALPAGELLHPLPLAAAALLVVNDWLLKGSGLLPPWATGILSDVAGLAFAPLLVTATADVCTLGLARLGVRVDFTLRRRKLALAIAATGGLFAALQLSPALAAAAASAWSEVIPGARLVADPRDLAALPALALAWWRGRREIAAVPLGRVELILRQRRSAAAELADVVACGGDPGDVAALARALDRLAEDDADAGADRDARRALASLRGRASPRGRGSTTL